MIKQWLIGISIIWISLFFIFEQGVEFLAHQPLNLYQILGSLAGILIGLALLK